MKKKLIIIGSILFVIGLLILLIVKIHKDEEVKNAVVEITLKEDRNVEFLTEFKVSDFIESINGQIVDDYTIDTTKLGTKEINYEYINDDGIRLKESFEITILDRTAPIIWLSGSYSTTKGSDIKLEEKIMCADNYDDNPTCVVEGSYDLNKVGTYPLVYKAKDISGNETEKKFNLIVKEPTKKGSTTTDSGKKTLYTDVLNDYKNENTQIGLDISKWQGDVNFSKLKEAGVEFIFIRVGTASGIDGERMVDSKFIQNIKGANEAGIPVGIYYYSYANSIERAREDAKWILEQVKDYKVDLPIAFDWENWSNYNKYHISIYKLTQMAKAYLDVFKDAGYQGINYSSKTYLENIWMDTTYDTWLAHYVKQTNYAGDYSFWQMCSNGRVDGIYGDVDIDIRYLNK